jgi:hypothetical protein
MTSSGSLFGICTASRNAVSGPERNPSYAPITSARKTASKVPYSSSSASSVQNSMSLKRCRLLSSCTQSPCEMCPTQFISNRLTWIFFFGGSAVIFGVLREVWWVLRPVVHPRRLGDN